MPFPGAGIAASLGSSAADIGAAAGRAALAGTNESASNVVKKVAAAVDQQLQKVEHRIAQFRETVAQKFVQWNPFEKLPDGAGKALAKTEAGAKQFVQHVDKSFDRIEKKEPFEKLQKEGKKDLDKSEKDFNKWGNNVEKQLTKMNSLKSKIIGGLATGIGAGIGKAIVGGILGGGGGAGGGGLGGLFDFSGLGDALMKPVAAAGGQMKAAAIQTQDERDKIAGIQNAMLRVSEVVDRLKAKFLLSLSPAISRFAEIFLSTMGRFGPSIDKWLARFEAVAFVAVEVGGAVVDAIADVIAEIDAWIDKTFELNTGTATAGEDMFRVFRMLGKAVAYVWDTVKAGAGIVAYVAGTIVEGFGLVVSAIGKAIDMVAKLAAELPEAIRPDWIKGAADAVKGWGAETERIGDNMSQWGKKAINGWGGSADKLDKWLDGVEQRFKNPPKFKAPAVIPQLSGAFARESADAYSIVAKFNTANSAMTPGNLTKQQLDAVKEGNRLIRELINQIKGADILKVV